jgi:hypothetical protein
MTFTPKSEIRQHSFCTATRPFEWQVRKPDGNTGDALIKECFDLEWTIMGHYLYGRRLPEIRGPPRLQARQEKT